MQEFKKNKRHVNVKGLQYGRSLPTNIYRLY